MVSDSAQNTRACKIDCRKTGGSTPTVMPHKEELACHGSRHQADFHAGLTHSKTALAEDRIHLGFTPRRDGVRHGSGGHRREARVIQSLGAGLQALGMQTGTTK
jgi:hypothetical protein